MLVLLGVLFCMGAVVLALCWQWLRKREQALEDAAFQIAESILDNRWTGIECSGEGAIYRLFHEINSLVSIVNAHADSEKQTKEFLKDTISNISHQLKTPIAALSVYNGILQQEAEDADAVRKFAALSEQELDRIEALVQSLLKMARLDAGAITLARLMGSQDFSIVDVQMAPGRRTRTPSTIWCGGHMALQTGGMRRTRALSWRLRCFSMAFWRSLP